MKRSKRAKLERNGWRVGLVVEFLALSPREAALVEAKFALNPIRKCPSSSSSFITSASMANYSHQSRC